MGQIGMNNMDGDGPDTGSLDRAAATTKASTVYRSGPGPGYQT